MSEKLEDESTTSLHRPSSVVERSSNSNLRSDAIQRWWPATQSLDLVEGPPDRVAAAVHTEVSRLLGRERLETSWESFANLDAAFGAPPDFANVPTVYLVLPTRSRWTGCTRE